MGRDVPRGLAHHIRDMTGLWRAEDRSDGELLSEFIAGDGSAFAALVVRHGRLVWTTCRRVLGNDADAEDAFQATFIALARNAGHVRPESVAAWIHKVSHTVALNARKAAQRRCAAERRLFDKAAGADDALPDEELRTAVADEVARLPEQLRVPLTLYYLEGRTQAEIGRIVGISDRAAAHRLKRALQRLRDRLSQRGVAVTAAILAAVLGNVPIMAAVPAALVLHATEMALATAAGGPVDSTAARLALEVAQAHGWVRLKLGSLILFPVLCLAVGGILLAQRPDQPARPEAPVPHVASAPSVEAPRTDRFGDPLPTGAVARLGTLRFRTGTAAGWPSVAFGPGGKVLISCHGENTVHFDTVHFWDPETGREVRKLTGPRTCGAVTTTPDGKRLAAAGADEVWAWDLSGDAPELLWKVRAKTTLANIEFSPDGKLIASGGDTGPAIHLLNADTGATVRTLAGTGDRFAFSADSKSLASWVRWKVPEVCVWDVATGKKRYSLTASGENKGVSSAAFSPDGKALAASGEDGSLRIWDVEKGTERHKLAQDADVNTFLGFAPDSRTLFDIGGGRIRSWNPTTGRVTKTAVSSVTGEWFSRFSSDATRLALARHSGIGLWDVTTGRELGVAAGMPHASVHPVVFSRSGSTLATATLDINGSTVQVWNAADGRPLRRFPVPPTQLVWSCDFAADGTLSALLGTVTELPPKPADRVVRWDTATGAVRSEVQLPAGTRCVTFAPDEQLMAVASSEAVLLCNRATGRMVKKLSDKCGADALVFSADGNALAAFDSTTGRTTIWSLTAEKEWKWPPANEADPKKQAAFRPSIALSPDGRLLAVGVEDRKSGVRVVDVATGTELWALEMDLYGGPGQEIAFSPDGRTLAASAFDGAVRVWEVASGKERYRFSGHRSGTRSVAFSHDGRRLASAGDDCTVLIWDVSTPQPPPVQRANPDQLWAALTALDAATAHRAIAALAATPDTAVPFLKERLGPPAAPAEQVRKWLKELSSEEFAVREAATAELARRGESLGPELRRALASETSPEARARLRRLVDALGPRSPSHRACVRGVEALERMGRDPAAVQLLQELAKLPAESVVGREARAAYRRLTEAAPKQK